MLMQRFMYGMEVYVAGCLMALRSNKIPTFVSTPKKSREQIQEEARKELLKYIKKG